MTDLYTVSVFLRPQGTVSLNYRSRTTAQEHHAFITRLMKAEGDSDCPVAPLTDDFGTDMAIDTTDVMVAVFQDLGKALEAQSESALLQAHAQAKVQRRAAADPMLKPPTVVPMPGGFRQ